MRYIPKAKHHGQREAELLRLQASTRVPVANPRAICWNTGLLEGSWVVISGVISRVTIVITHISGLITLLITTHEPSSKVLRDL